MKPLNEQELEKLLKTLPKFERSAKAEAKFFKKLDAMAQEKKVAPFGLEEKTVWFAWPKLALAGSFAAFILIVGGTFAAYQPTVTRGTFLYPWKQAGERVELAVAFTSLQKVDAHVRFSDRRLSEAENIIAKNPSLAWLAPKVSAHEGELHLDTEEAVYLAETLADMRQEISLASEIVEVKISQPAEVEKALAKIEVAAERHVEVLTKMEEKGEITVKEIVKRIAEEEDEHLAVVVEAREVVKAAEVRKEARVMIQLKKRTEKEEKHEIKESKLEDRKEQAQQELKEAFEFFEKLPEEKKKDLQEKMERAREALEEGKLGRTKGLSRAILNEIEHFPGVPVKPETPTVPDPFKSPPQKYPDPGFRELKEKREKEQAEKDKDDKEDKKEADHLPIDSPALIEDPENIYGLNPLLSPPKPEDMPKENPDNKFLMELEEIKDSEGVFEETEEPHRIDKKFESKANTYDYRNRDISQ